ncbi:MAG: flagellin, partial [Desulfobulbaceae bacterium]|nr:flagellin [Desulfobulbaceae bacterium]
INVLTQEGAQAAIGIVDQALEQVGGMRAEIGAMQNQLSSTVSNLSVTAINVQSAQSSIADVDYAEESMVFARMKALNKAKVFAATQANNLNKGNVLNLLQG